ncbi:hypothetical protein O181_002658 [Austropuccinia psidii MF-1]|uniref:Uncharacterized protein n=1 Tax=Austropuccinia psidii MF-1 TaxID=1389203 RepID=A0A9Q3BD53_9BASI|nr:hypothetical protein [Austropuccinia psidii MF-1]
MKVQNSPPPKNTRSQRHQAVLTPTARAPLYRTPSVNQLSGNLDRGPPMKGEEIFRRRGIKSRKSISFYGFLEEESEETEVADALEGAPEASEAPNLGLSNQPIFFQDINVYRRGLASRLLDKLASHPCNFDTLQALMDITLELDKRYHERQKEKGSHQEKKPPDTGSNSSRPPQDSSFKKPHHKKRKKGKNFQVSRDRPHASLLNKDNKLIVSEKERRIKAGLCTYCG